MSNKLDPFGELKPREGVIKANHETATFRVAASRPEWRMRTVYVEMNQLRRVRPAVRIWSVSH